MKNEDQFLIEVMSVTPTRFISEWGGTMRCFTSDGRIVNMADELNRLESEMKKIWDKVEIDHKFEDLE